ncbi:MAG TPA: hypothetical protein VLB85_09665 [Acidimicrobiia bacterium]|nr:hypothetical protein [Acidimicrobiia bacterium]
MTERGSASVELALGIAMLVVPAVVAVISFAPWLEARAFVRAAAAEAARAAVLTPAGPAEAGARAVADMAAGRDMAGVIVVMCGGGPCVVQRGEVVGATVTVEIPLVTTPWGPVGGITVEASHSEPVDLYRSLP